MVTAGCNFFPYLLLLANVTPPALKQSTPSSFLVGNVARLGSQHGSELVSVESHFNIATASNMTGDLQATYSHL